MYETSQKRRYKRLLRSAAKYIHALAPRTAVGMCAALYNTSLAYTPAERISCTKFVTTLYHTDSNTSMFHSMFWMGPEFTEEQQNHRVMALLFAAECLDDTQELWPRRANTLETLRETPPR